MREEAWQERSERSTRGSCKRARVEEEGTAGDSMNRAVQGKHRKGGSSQENMVKRRRTDDGAGREGEEGKGDDQGGEEGKAKELTTQLKLSAALSKLMDGRKYSTPEAIAKQPLIDRLCELDELSVVETKSDDKTSLGKRSRTDDSNTKDVQLKLGPALSGLMDGCKYCRAEEITKQQCIDRLTALGELVEVETFQVSVQMLSSYTFSVTMDSTDNKVSRLRALIEDTQGTKPYLQDLIVVPQAASGGGSKDAEMSEGEGAALAEDGVIGPCSVLLCVKVETGLYCSESSHYFLCCLVFCGCCFLCIHCD